MFIFAKVDAKNADRAVEALRPFAVDAPLLMEAAPTPSPPSVNTAEAEKIADAIAPTAKQPMRREVLQALYRGHDTYLSQNGEPDANFRNGTAALSRALRPFSMFASPLDILFERRRRLVASGLYKGKYEATEYIPTVLGKAVGEILKARKVL